MTTPTLPTEASAYHISVLIPTRGRPDRLEHSIRSLVDLAHSPKRLQIMVIIDNDDEATNQHLKDTITPWLNQQGIDAAIMSVERMGYVRLNEYYNRLAAFARGEWLMVWNDDAVMKEQDWDAKIGTYDGEFKILAFNTHNHHPYSIFPVIPADWYRLLGTLSNHQMIDAVVSQIAYLLDIMQRTDILVDHERADLEKDSSKADSTYRERVMLEGNPEDPRDLNSSQHRNMRFLWADRLAWWMRGQNLDISFWESVKAGKQDPWEKLKANDPNGLTKQDQPK